MTACSLFSSDKKLPQGERLSIIEAKDDALAQTKAKGVIKISEPQDIQGYYQIGGNEAHRIGNIKVSKNMEEVYRVSFEHGASKQNLILAHPVIDNNLLYMQNVEGTIYAFDLKNGERVFKQKLKSLNKNDAESTSNGAGLAAGKGRIYALTGFGGVFALDGLNGDVIWRKDLATPIRTSPTLARDKLFVLTIDNHLYALNVADGSEIWQYSVSSEDTVLAGGASGAYDQESETYITAFSNGELTAFNARIGYPVWSVDMAQVSDFGASTGINSLKASPVIDKKMVISVGPTNTSAIDLTSGDILWRRYISGSQTPIVDQEVIYLISDAQTLVALNQNDGTILWQVDVLEKLKRKERAEIILSGPLLVGGKLMITASNGMIYLFKAQNGTLEAEINTNEDLSFAPIVAQKNIVFTTDNAKLLVYK